MSETHSSDSPGYLEQLVGGQDAQSIPPWAKKLNDLKYIYIVYAALDGLSLSYSMLKYLFDLLTKERSFASDRMHDWLMSPEGAAAAATASVTLIAFSMLASYFDEGDNNYFKSYIAILWPYWRDMMKALKNGYKGFRSLIQIVELLSNGRNLAFLFVPVGLLLGCISVVNRLWYRSVITDRKGMMKENAEILKNIKAISQRFAGSNIEAVVAETEKRMLAQLGMSEKDIAWQITHEIALANSSALLEEMRGIDKRLAALDQLLGAIVPEDEKVGQGPENIKRHKNVKRQTERQKALGLLSATYGGIIDGLYLYIGIFGLCSFTPPVLMVMAVFSTIYLATCIATRIYEEYDYQGKLHIAEAKLEMAASGKKIELLVLKLNVLKALIDYAPDENSTLLPGQETESKLVSKQLNLITEIKENVALFCHHKRRFTSLTTLSYTRAFLAGAKSGLFAYGTLASSLFAIGVILTLAGITFPPALLATAISLGMVLLTGFIVQSLINAHNDRKSKENEAIEKFAEVKRLEAYAKGDHAEKNDETKKGDFAWLYNMCKKSVKELKPELVKTAILDGMAIKPTPSTLIEAWLEVLRSFFTGIGKGAKAIILSLNFLEVADSKGHYHESAVMIGFIVISALVHTLALALRAYARMGKEPPVAPFLAYETVEPNCKSPKMTKKEVSYQTPGGPDESSDVKEIKIEPSPETSLKTEHANEKVEEKKSFFRNSIFDFFAPSKLRQRESSTPLPASTHASDATLSSSQLAGV